MISFIDEQDAIQAVYDATGLEFEPDNPFNRVSKHERKKGKGLIQIRNKLTSCENGQNDGGEHCENGKDD